MGGNMVKHSPKPMCSGCQERPAVATGLCHRCYKRRAAGKPLIDPTVERIGQPDGHGQYGVLDNDGDTVLCHECGRRLRSLGYHLFKVHGTTADAYRRDHGLARGLALVAASLSETMSQRATARLGTAAWHRFEEARDPAAASAARDFTNRPAQTKAHNASHAAGIGQSTRRTTVRTCPHCGATWCPLPGGYRRKTCRSTDCLKAERAANKAAHTAREAAKRRPLTADEAHQLRTLTGNGLADLVRALLQEGMQQCVLAPAVGIGEATLSRLLNGHRVRSTDQPRPTAAEPTPEQKPSSPTRR